MDAFTALLTRNSAARLVAPAPEGELRERILRAALRAPDHGRLRPWRFLVVEGEGRGLLGEAMARAMACHDPEIDEAALAKLRANPLRAPLLVLPVAHLATHPKVPESEQLLSVACAAQNILLAAHAAGFGGMWRTGAVTYTEALHRELELAANERLLGFLYLGTPEGAPKPLEELALGTHVRTWPAR
jgi:nitroreductase